MKRLWIHREVEAPSAVLWELLTDPACWPAWGPTVRGAQLHDERLERGSRGSVTTMVGLVLPFEITDYEDGARWTWKVLGVGATAHIVEPLGPDRCRVGFGVPWPVAPYLAICRRALAKLDDLARRSAASA